MLKINEDRLDYADILKPPAGFKLDQAVGTTYSLDLDALVGACFSLELSEEPDSALMKNPVCLLEILRKAADKVTLFCEDGQIHLPGHNTRLYIFLEKMVYPVKTKSRREAAAYPSFHPKFWLLRYVRGKEIRYRIAVLSRNLTFDRSWDTAFYMNGVPQENDEVNPDINSNINPHTGHDEEKNVPLEDFLYYLEHRLPRTEEGKKRIQTIRRMRKELSGIRFSTGQKEFSDFEFLPCGIPRRESADGSGMYSFLDTDLFQNTFHELMIISPFLSPRVIADFNSRKNTRIKDPKYVLISRAMSIGKLKPEDCSHFQIYRLKDRVVDGETEISDEQQDIRQEDIHAKIYMMRKYSDTDLYLGSLNASHNALHGNVEFMIRLKSQNRYLNLQKMEEDLFGRNPDENPFEEVTAIDDSRTEEADPTEKMQKIIKELCRAEGHVRIMPAADHCIEDGGANSGMDHDADAPLYYEAALTFPDLKSDIGKGFTVTVRPLYSQMALSLAESMRFHPLTERQLSAFYAVSVSDGEYKVERVLMLPTEGFPEGREKTVISDIVSSRKNFYSYVSWILDDDPLMGELGFDGRPEQGLPYGNASDHGQMVPPALYEKMLRASVWEPEKLKDIASLLDSLPDGDAVPPEFSDLYDTFRKAMKNSRGRRNG